MKIVNSHSHLFEIKNYEIPSYLLPVIVGYSHSSNKKAVKIATENDYPFVLGIAPQTAIRGNISELDDWVAFIEESKPNAIGEIGLDYKWAQTMKDVEIERVVFKKLIDLAKKMKLPLVIHSRNNPNKNDVPKDAIQEIIKKLGDLKFVMHFYSGNDTQAKEIIELGGYISVTHLHSKERRKVINTVPIDRLLVESDSPYVGRTPETIKEAIAYIAEIKELDYNEVAVKTAENAARFFNFRLNL